MDLTSLSALELGRKIKNKEISVVEATKAQLDIIEKQEEVYHCYITQLRDEALSRAMEVQLKLNAGEYENSPLAGVPMALKDNICTKGITTTCASKMLEQFIPPYSATVVEKLEKAGAVFIGKTNMDEFSIGSTSETSYFGVTKNPWNIEHVPGGSSGGSAAAVAAKEAFYALGSDTGGSIRQPSSFCGVTGIKPTYGTVSRYGLIAYASSLDQIGPIGRNVADCCGVLDIITGYDSKDSTSLNRQYESYLNNLTEDIAGLRIGIPKGYFGEGLEEEVRENVLNAAKILKEKGAHVEEFDLEAIDYAVPAYYVIASAQASSNLSRYDGVKYGYRTPDFDSLSDIYKKSRSEGFGDEVKLRIMMGAFVLNSDNFDAYYKKALKVKTLIKESFEKAFKKYDVILGPTAPTTAYKIGKSLLNPLQMYLGDVYTVAVNLVGLPAMSLPCGIDRNGMPIGLQLIGNHFNEKDILRTAFSFEKSRDSLGLMKINTKEAMQ